MRGEVMKRLEIQKGARFGKLTVVEETRLRFGSRPHVARAFVCRCDCGRLTTVPRGHLVSGHTRSCGCGRVKHHECLTDLYKKWAAMIGRCRETTGDHVKYYFARGITVCPEWATDYRVFRDWSRAHGYEPGLSLDRIDNDKGYSPDNCRWVTLKEQGRNKRNNRMFTLFGETHPMPYWCERFNTYPQLVMQRLKRGWSVEAAFTEEVQ